VCLRASLQFDKKQRYSGGSVGEGVKPSDYTHTASNNVFRPRFGTSDNAPGTTGSTSSLSEDFAIGRRSLATTPRARDLTTFVPPSRLSRPRSKYSCLTADAGKRGKA